MKQKINIEVKGHLKITSIKKGEKPQVLYNDHNALIPNYKNIIRHAIAGDISYAIDRVRVLGSSVPLATTVISSVSYIPLTDNEVKFIAVFDEASFDGTFDEVFLFSDAGGDFSQVTGLSITKDNQTQLQIEWTLKIINN